jgi:peroxiredoxin
MSSRRSHIHICSVLFIGIAIATPSVGLRQVHAQHTGVNADVSWSDGNRVAGQLEALDDRIVKVRSRVFRDPILIGRDKLQQISVPQDAQPNAVKLKHSLQLKDGSVIHGDVEALDQGDFQLQSPRFGTLVIPRDAVERVVNLESQLYEWRGSLSDWNSPQSDKSLSWNVNASDELSTQERDARAWMEMTLSSDFVLEISLQSKSIPDFAISFGEEPDASLRIATIGENVILGTATDFEVAHSFSKNDHEFTFLAEWDASSHTMMLHSSNGAKLASIRENVPSHKPGILIVNQGRDLSIRSMRISRSVSPEQSIPASAGKSDATSGRSTRRELDEFQQISKETIQFADGDSIRGRLIGLVDGHLKIFCQELRSTMTCSSMGFRRLTCEPRSDVSFNQVAGERLLKIGANRMRGTMRFGAREAAIWWKGRGTESEIRLDVRMPGLLSKSVEGSSGLDVSRWPDLLYLVNGDVIPCRFHSFRRGVASLSTPFHEELDLADSAMSGIDFEGSLHPRSHAFTRESRERMLTVPRSLRGAEFKNALLSPNGDLLRGELLNVNSSQIEFESKLEPILIDRSRVRSIVFLAPSSASKEHPEPDHDLSSNTSSISLRFVGGYRLTIDVDRVNALPGRESSLLGTSKHLGACSIEEGKIETIELGQTDPDPELARYSSWRTSPATEPRWKNNPMPSGPDRSLVGSKAPDFELAMLDGSEFKRSEHAGKLIVLDFWATWCGPCVKALPEYIQALSEFSPNDVLFLGVNATETPEVVRTFIKERQLASFNTLFDYDSSLSRSMQVNGIPHTVVIGPDGTILHEHVGYTSTAAEEIQSVVRQNLPSNLESDQSE